MQHGDIDNRTPPIILVGADLLAPLPADDDAKARKAERRKHWDIAVGYRLIDPYAVGILWRFGGRLGVRFDLAVFDKHPSYAAALRERFDVENIPIRQVLPYLSPQHLAKTLAYRPDILGVLDVPANGLAYGSHYISDLRGMAA